MLNTAKSAIVLFVIFGLIMSADDIDRLITDIIQHADYVKNTAEEIKPIMQWKSYPKMREAVEKLIDDRIEDYSWHRNVGDE